MKTTTTNTTTNTTALYQQAFKHTLTALNSINSRHYSSMLYNLMNQVGNDKRALTNIDIAIKETEQKAEKDETRAELNEIIKILNRVTISQEQRDELAEQYAQTHKEYENELDHLADTRLLKSLNFSDLMDDVQEYLLGTLENITPKNTQKALDRHQLIINNRAEQHTKQLDRYLLPQFNAAASAQFFYSQIDELQAEHIAELETIYNGKSFVTHFIRSNKAPNPLDGTTTKYKDATAENVTKWLEQGHKISTKNNPYYIQLSNQDRISLVIKDNKYQFRIQHATYKKGLSIENFRTEKGEVVIDGLITSYNMYADSIGALERIQELGNTANLTERERDFISAFCSKPAIIKQGKAHIKYFDKHYDNACKYNKLALFYKRIEQYSYLVRLNYSFERIGLSKASTKSMFIKRLLTRLHKAKKHHNFIELIKTDTEYLNYIMTTNRGISTATLNNRQDLIQWTNQATPQAPTNVIKWTKSDIRPQPITAEERVRAEQDEKHRQELTKIYQFKLDLYKSLRDADRYNNNGTYSAKYSAFTFFNNLPERKQLQIAHARLDEIAEDKARAEKLKTFKSVSVAEWLKMSRAEKDEYKKKFDEHFNK